MLEHPSDPSAGIAAAWRSVQPSEGEIQRARARLHRKAVGIAALVAMSYWVLVISDAAAGVRILAALGLVAGLFAVGTSVMHDANHGSFSRRVWLNRLVACTSDALGASSMLWRVQHNALHHGNTNVVGVDTDLELAPFARLAPGQKWHWWYRAQHIYIWPLYGFLTLKNLLVADLVTVLTGRLDGRPLRTPIRRRTVAGITVGKLAHIGWAVIVPLLFNPWHIVLIFYLACSWLVGFMLAITFQLAHAVDVTDVATSSGSRRGVDFAAHQLHTTADIDSPSPVVGHVFRFLVGGLDHQVEHHLSPKLPHTLYAEMSRRFRIVCADKQIALHVHPGIAAAIRSHVRWLRLMSRPDAV